MVIRFSEQSFNSRMFCIIRETQWEWKKTQVMLVKLKGFLTSIKTSNECDPNSSLTAKSHFSPTNLIFRPHSFLASESKTIFSVSFCRGIPRLSMIRWTVYVSIEILYSLAMFQIFFSRRFEITWTNLQIYFFFLFLLTVFLLTVKIKVSGRFTHPLVMRARGCLKKRLEANSFGRNFEVNSHLQRCEKSGVKWAWGGERVCRDFRTFARALES